MSQAQTEIETFLESEREWRERCLAAERDGGGGSTVAEEVQRLGRHPKFGTGTVERIAESERWRMNDRWHECVVLVEVDRRTRALISREPLSIAESRKRWPVPVVAPTTPLSLEERISRLEGLARRRGDLQDGDLAPAA